MRDSAMRSSVYGLFRYRFAEGDAVERSASYIFFQRALGRTSAWRGIAAFRAEAASAASRCRGSWPSSILPAGTRTFSNRIRAAVRRVVVTEYRQMAQDIHAPSASRAAR